MRRVALYHYQPILLNFRVLSNERFYSLFRPDVLLDALRHLPLLAYPRNPERYMRTGDAFQENLATHEGIEPPLRVLETPALPLY